MSAPTATRAWPAVATDLAEDFSTALTLRPDHQQLEGSGLKGGYGGGDGHLRSAFDNAGNGIANASCHATTRSRGSWPGFGPNTGSTLVHTVSRPLICTIPAGDHTWHFDIEPLFDWNDAGWNNHYVFVTGGEKPTYFRPLVVQFKSATQFVVFCTYVNASGVLTNVACTWTYGGNNQPALPSGRSPRRFIVCVHEGAEGQAGSITCWVEDPAVGAANSGYRLLTSSGTIPANAHPRRKSVYRQMATDSFRYASLTGTSAHDRAIVSNIVVLPGLQPPSGNITYFTANEAAVDMNTNQGAANFWAQGFQQQWPYVARGGTQPFAGQGTNDLPIPEGGMFAYAGKGMRCPSSSTYDPPNFCTEPGWSSGRTIPVRGGGTRIGKTRWWDPKPFDNWWSRFRAAGGTKTIYNASACGEQEGWGASEFRAGGTLDRNVSSIAEAGYIGTHPTDVNGWADYLVDQLHYARTNYPECEILAIKIGPPEYDTTSQWAAANAAADHWACVDAAIQALDNYATTVGWTLPRLIVIGFSKVYDAITNLNSFATLATSMIAAGYGGRDIAVDIHYHAHGASIAHSWWILSQKWAALGGTGSLRTVELEAFHSDTLGGPNSKSGGVWYQGSDQPNDTQLEYRDVYEMTPWAAAHEAHSLIALLTDPTCFWLRGYSKFSMEKNPPDAQAGYWYYAGTVIDPTNGGAAVETQRMGIYRMQCMMGGTLRPVTFGGNPAYSGHLAGVRTDGKAWYMGVVTRQPDWTIAGQDTIVVDFGATRAGASFRRYRITTAIACYWQNGWRNGDTTYQPDQRIKVEETLVADGSGRVTVTGVSPLEVFFLLEGTQTSLTAGTIAAGAVTDTTAQVNTVTDPSGGSGSLVPSWLIRPHGNGAFSLVAGAAALSVNLTSDLSPSSSYDIKRRVTDGAGASADSNVVTFTTAATPTPIVTGVVLSPATATVLTGGLLQMSSQVQGSGNPDQTVDWDLPGDTTGASISTGGLLTAGIPGTITVRATSRVAPGISGTAIVEVVAVAAGGSEVVIYVEGPFTIEPVASGPDARIKRFAGDPLAIAVVLRAGGRRINLTGKTPVARMIDGAGDTAAGIDVQVDFASGGEMLLAGDVPEEPGTYRVTVKPSAEDFTYGPILLEVVA